MIDGFGSSCFNYCSVHLIDNCIKKRHPKKKNAFLTQLKLTIFSKS